jgi:hypothetical protein
VSSCAIIFLVLGDMAAALIGVSFGGEVASLKLGREGKKSVEGSLAMFCVCFLVAMVFFWDVQLSEYAAVVAAATATLTELYEPLLLDDNLTIPSRAVWKSTSELRHRADAATEKMSRRWRGAPEIRFPHRFFSALALQVALCRVRCPPCANVREARCYLF